MIKGYKIRLYPNKRQEELFFKHIGCCRFVWNYMLNLQWERRRKNEKRLYKYDMINLMLALKKQEEYKWLQDVSAHSLNDICIDLDNTYERYFKKLAKYPRFKTKKGSKKSFPVREDRMFFEEKTVRIEKIGDVKYKTDFDLPLGREHKIMNARIAYLNEKWILTFNLECENQAPKLNDFSIGIDLGVKDLATVAFKDKKLVFHNINKSKKMKKLNERLKYYQRSVSRKYEANKQGNKYVKTKNIEKQERKIRKLYARISNIRLNYIHQITHQLVSMLPERVIMEDLNVTGMMKNKHLSKVIQEQCFYEFRRQMEYKCAWNGINFVLADRYFPSSKTCSCCGSYKKDLKLKDRTYICDECGAIIDRDYNAAINLMNYMV